jgi:hypothetical protein
LSAFSAAASVIFSVFLPSIFRIRSPGINPARPPGESSIGERMTSPPSLTPMTMPSPLNSPFVSRWMSWKLSSSRNWLWGSSDDSIPRSAA